MIVTKDPIQRSDDDELGEQLESFLNGLTLISKQISNLSKIHKKKREGYSCQYRGNSSHDHVDSLAMIGVSQHRKVCDLLL